MLNNYMVRIQKTGQFGSVCIGNPLDFWKWALKSKFSRNSNSKVGKFKCHPNGSQLGKIFSEGEFLFIFTCAFWFSGNISKKHSLVTVICPSALLTWLLTRGRLLTFSYFEVRKSRHSPLIWNSSRLSTREKIVTSPLGVKNEAE